MERNWSVEGRGGCVFGEGGPVVWAVTSPEEGRALWERMQPARWTLVTVEAADWNAELSPWPGKAVFRGQPDFAGGAPAFLTELERLLPEVERRVEISAARRFLMGYSMGGLFALYAAMSSNCFDGAASVSGSLWYDGFLDWMRAAPRVPKWAYCSVGDRESRSRNRVFRCIGERTREAAEILAQRGAKAHFEQRPGGHFDDPVGSLARAVRWILEETKE